MKKFITLIILIFLFQVSSLWAAEIRLSIGEKRTLHFPGLKKFHNTNSKLVRAKILPDQEEVILTALSKGNGELFVQDQEGSRTVPLIIFSKLALDLEREIKELTSDIEGILVRSVGHKVLISGKILTPQDVKTIERISKMYENVMNMTQSAASAQILTLEKMIHIDVKMMELNKQKLQHLGIEFPESLTNHFSLLSHFQKGAITSTLQMTTEFNLIFRALEKNGYSKILANPKLVCKNGGEADFLAGGEVPLKLSRGRDLSIQWKPYGILLHINPQADNQNNIATTLKVEVSTLNPATAVEGIPGLLTRKLQTSANVPSGKTIVLSGLIHHENREDIQALPPLSHLPVLGELFSSKQFQHKETELIIFITPSIYEN